MSISIDAEAEGHGFVQRSFPLDAVSFLSPSAGARQVDAVVLGRRPPSIFPMAIPGLKLVHQQSCSNAWHVCYDDESIRNARGVNGPVLQIEQAHLQIPPFKAAQSWLGVTVGRLRTSDGVWRAGSVAQALNRSVVPDLRIRARAAGQKIVRERLGGSYWADSPSSALLVEIGAGLAIVAAHDGDECVVRAMLLTACLRVGAARTLLLLPFLRTARETHLETFARGIGCRACSGPVDLWPLLDAAAEVHVPHLYGPGSSLELLAQLAGVPVHVAGDHRAEEAVEPDEITAAAFIVGASYVDPFTGSRCTPEHALDLVSLWRRTCDENRKVTACVGVQFWKRNRIAQFLHTGVRGPAFQAAASSVVVAAGPGAIAVWASRVPVGLERRAKSLSIPILRMEDGFLRSVGLGSDFNLPCSIVLDRSGLYYDPSRPSDLETILNSAVFSAALIERAQSLVTRIVAARATKYGTGNGPLPDLPSDGRRVILVVGQVADDLSMTLGAGAASGNADLLVRVRAANPDAFIIYRPHPDVDAGHRPGAIPDLFARRHADILARGASMGALIDVIDELHTMTSLAGFEALLRNRQVVVWGRPFYAGWGLTQDLCSLDRRRRRLDLLELAAGVLILYPRYLDPVTEMPCPAEVVLDRMALTNPWRPSWLVRLRRKQGQARLAWRSTRKILRRSEQNKLGSVF